MRKLWAPVHQRHTKPGCTVALPRGMQAASSSEKQPEHCAAGWCGACRAVVADPSASPADVLTAVAGLAAGSLRMPGGTLGTSGGGGGKSSSWQDAALRMGGELVGVPAAEENQVGLVLPGNTRAESLRLKKGRTPKPARRQGILASLPPAVAPASQPCKPVETPACLSACLRACLQACLPLCLHCRCSLAACR